MLISVMDLFLVYDLFPNITSKYQFFLDFPSALSKTGFSWEIAYPIHKTIYIHKNMENMDPALQLFHVMSYIITM